MYNYRNALLVMVMRVFDGCLFEGAFLKDKFRWIDFDGFSTDFDRFRGTFFIFFNIRKEWSFYMISAFSRRADNESHGIESPNTVVQKLSLNVQAQLTWIAYNF